MYLVDEGKKNLKGALVPFTKNINKASIKEYSKTNKVILREIVDYVIKLKNDKTINDKQFNELIYLACSNYIENEIDSKVGLYIENKINSLF